jgi:hypothetical protein
MLRKVSELSHDQRLAIESLLGRQLADDEGLNICPSKVLSEGPSYDQHERVWSGFSPTVTSLQNALGTYLMLNLTRW